MDYDQYDDSIGFQNVACASVESREAAVDTDITVDHMQSNPCVQGNSIYMYILLNFEFCYSGTSYCGKFI